MIALFPKTEVPVAKKTTGTITFKNLDKFESIQSTRNQDFELPVEVQSTFKF